MISPRRSLTSSSYGTSSATDGWWERAACRNADPDAFTPPPDEYRPMTPAEAAYARTYCARCPVTAECLQDALAKGDDYGIRGGIDMASRNKRRRTKTAAAAVPAQPKATATVKAQPAKKRNPTQEARRAADRARAHKRRAEGTEPPCGTRAGYDHHRAIGEPYCDPCRNYRAAESQTERDRNRNRRPTQADTLVPEVLHLVSAGAGIHEAARATRKTVGALEKALYRAKRPDLLHQLRRTA